MRWYHWFFIVVLQVFVSIFVMFLFVSQVKVISFMEMSAMGVEDIAKAIQSGKSQEEIQKSYIQRLNQAQQRLQDQWGIILLKECVVKGPFKDITHEVFR